MTLKTTKDHLVQLLEDKDNKVIALSGKWGTGKSHLWGEVKTASADEGVKGALCVSLCGLSDMSQIEFVETAIWDHRVSNSTLLANAEAFASRVHLGA
jgi:hypothetical protein